MRKTATIITCALAMAAGACQAWEIIETTDAMTDERSYTLMARSEKLVTVEPYVQVLRRAQYTDNTQANRSRRPSNQQAGAVLHN